MFVLEAICHLPICHMYVLETFGHDMYVLDTVCHMPVIEIACHDTFPFAGMA